MERVKSNYPALHVLKKARPKLRKAIVLHCVLIVFNSNVRLTGCAKRKLRKYKAVLRKVADKRVPLSGKMRLIVQEGGFLLPLLTAVQPALASYIFRPRNNNDVA